MKRRLILSAIGLVILAVGGVCLYYWVSLHRAESRLAEAKANVPFSLAMSADGPEAWGSPPDADDNAAPLYEQAGQMLDELFTDVSGAWREYSGDAENIRTTRELDAAEKQRRTEELRAQVTERTRLSSERDLLMVAWGVVDRSSIVAHDDEGREITPPTPGRDVERAQRFLDEIADLRGLRDRIVARRGCRGCVDWSEIIPELPDVKHFQTLARLTALESLVAADAGRWDEAWRLAADMLVMADHLRREPILVQQLLACGVRRLGMAALATLLARHAPDDASRERLMGLLSVDASTSLQAGIVTECVMGDRIFDDFLAGRYGSGPSGQQAPKNPAARIISWFVAARTRPSLLSGQAVYLETFTALFEAAGKPPMESILESEDVMREVDARLDSPSGPGDRLFGMLMPSMEGYFEEIHREAAECRLARVALVVAAYRDANGRYPSALSDIAAPQALLVDPFGGEAFHYRTEGNGFILWSVGLNGEDDGGKTREEVEAEYEARGEQCPYKHIHGDIAFRVPPKETR